MSDALPTFSVFGLVDALGFGGQPHWNVLKVLVVVPAWGPVVSHVTRTSGTTEYVQTKEIPVNDTERRSIIHSLTSGRVKPNLVERVELTAGVNDAARVTVVQFTEVDRMKRFSQLLDDVRQKEIVDLVPADPCAVCGKPALHTCGEYRLCDDCEEQATTCYDDECDGLCFDGKRVPAMQKAMKQNGKH